jgi:hypothetical protein
MPASWCAESKALGPMGLYPQACFTGTNVQILTEYKNTNTDLKAAAPRARPTGLPSAYCPPAEGGGASLFVLDNLVKQVKQVKHAALTQRRMRS